jgi:hypothetical protein
LSREFNRNSRHPRWQRILRLPDQEYLAGEGLLSLKSGKIDFLLQFVLFCHVREKGGYVMKLPGVKPVRRA